MKLSLRILYAVGLALLAASAVNAAPVINVTGVTASPASVSPGQGTTFSVAVTNGGLTTPGDDLPVGTTANASITLTNSVTNYSFTLTGTATSTSLIVGAGGSGAMTFSGTIPTKVTEAGTYSAVITLSAPSGTATLGTASATASGTVLTVTGTPDFEITGLTYQAGTSYSGGDVIPMSISYRNRSRSPGATTNNVPWVPSTTGNSTYVRIQIVLSSNPVYGDADDFRLTFTDRTTKLNADDSVQTFSWNQLIPGNFSGSYYVLAKIDSLETNAETIENDLTLNGNNIWLDVNAPRLSIQPTNFPTNYLASTTGSASGNGYSDNPAVSSDGRYTVFASDASNLISGDTNGTRDIFIFDNQTNTTRRLNVSRQGAQANGPSNRPAITANGRYVAFESNATNLVLGDTNGFSDIFVVDTITGAISLLSVDSTGTQANNSSFRPSISSTGRYVTFESTATNLVSSGTTVGVSHIYLRDRDVSGSGTFDTAGNTSTVLVSQSTAGVAGNGNSLQAVISADGSYIAYASDATNLVSGDTNAKRDIFLRNRSAGTTIRVSVATGGTEATGGDSRTPSISSDGTYIAFASDATNLVAGDTNGVSDVFVYNRSAATTVRVSVSTAGVEASDPSGAGFKLGSINPSISSTGRYVAFASLANNLTAGDSVGQSQTLDSNSSLDIFVRDRDVSASGTFDTAGNVATSMVSVNKFGMQTIGVLGQQSTSSADIFPSISADGRWVAYPSDAEGASGLSHTTTNLISQDANSARDVFLFDRRTNALPGTSVAPSVTITSPGTATSILVNTAVPITASATTTIGVVSTVQFFVNGTSLGTSSTFPYTQTWTPTAVGTYILSALVTDSFGNLGVSANLSVTVNAAPSVGVTSPVAGSTITAGVAQTVTATAAATTPGATISSVQFFANGISLGTDTTAPYSAPWTPASAGSFNLTATATDSLGTQTTSPVVAITVIAAGGGGGGGGGLTAPIVSINTPSDGSTIAVNTPQVVNATASLTNGTVTSVAFSANGVSIGSATSFPYTVQWTPTTAGTFTLSAVATGSNGAQATITNTITVVSAGSPTVTLTSPLGGSVLPVNALTTIYATAADADGTIKNVQFYANGVLLSTSTVFPYSAPFTPTSPGTYVLFAIATDNVGNQTTSSAISVTVSGGTAPTVAITSPLAGSTVGVNLPQTLTATAASTGGFIANVQFLVNGVVLTTAGAFPYITAWTPTATGTYTLSARATDNSGNVTTSAPVSITVAASAPPTVSITSPATGSSYTVGSSLNITATAADSDGTIAKVAFLVNGIVLSTDTTSPYSAAGWTPASTGVYTLTAQATDNTGNVTTSAPVTVTIGANAAPTVSLTSPSAGLSFSLGNGVLIGATASDSDGTVANVQFFANGLGIGSVSAPPYSLSWRPTSAGTFALTAVATDNAGNSTTSAAVSVSVTSSPAPLVSITNPASGASFGVGTTIPLNANATGGNGPISQVQFFVNGVSLSTDNTAPYTATWTPNSAGTYSLLAVATDSAGVSGTSTAVTIVITPNGAPSVSLVSPGTNLVVALGTSVNISATASDSDGTVASVRFLANGTVLATKSAQPYSTVFTPTAAGIYTIVAQATDNSGNVTDSVAETITVLGGNVPIVTLLNPTADTTISADSSLLLSADASVATGFIGRVEFYSGTTLLATKTVAPYTYVWRPGVIGTYAIRAVAYDGNGNGVSSSVSTVTVAAPIARPGDFYVKFASPTDGSSLVAFRNITFLAVTNIPTTNNPQVDFYANGSIFQTVSSAPFQTTRNPAIAGNFEFYAVVRVSGSTYTSDAVSVTVLANQPPTVSLTSPTTGSTINVGSSVTIRASASDPDDSIDNVKFLVNGQILSTSTAFPYTASWTPTAEGIYTLQAIAKDSQGSVAGNQTTSSPIYVKVAASAANGGTGSAPDTTYAGTYAGGSESGKFAVISVAGKSAAFIAYTTSGTAKSYFYPSLSIDASGGFSLTVGSTNAITGRVNDTGVSGSFDNSRLTFIGPVSFATATKVASGYYTGNIANRASSTLAAIVGSDGSITAYVSDGSFSDAGAGAVDSAGNFSLTLAGGTKLVGKADPLTGFLSGTLTGGPGGTFMGALASGGTFSDGTLRNLSTRGQVGTGGNILIAGFVVGGTSPKQVLVRAIGPTLTNFGITGALADPQVDLFKGGTRIGTNDNWGGSSVIAAAAAAVGAFPLPAGSLDAVILAQLQPGAYTAQVSGVGGKTGVALVELYDVDTVSAFSPQKVINVSTRGVVGTGENILIAGFVVNGSTSKKLLIRGIGPTLGALGVTGALADPVLQIIRNDNKVVRENDNWETGNDASLVADATTKVGAFPLASGSKDSVLLINLPPGTYSATVSGVNGATGVGLVEVYEVP